MTDPALELRDLASGLRARLEAGEGDGFTVSAPRPAVAAVLPVPQPAPAAILPSALGSGGSERLAVLRAEVEACRLCPLGSQRLRSVFGVGSPTAAVMFIGEGPGFQEDHDGEPFVGKSGKLLDDILRAIGLSRETVYIANVVKCHPMSDPSDPEKRGNDRPPSPEEVAACRPYLDEQIRLIAPRVLVTLGSVATKVLLGEDLGISKIRGAWRSYDAGGAGGPIRLLPTYHPAALLRNPELKRDVWTDMKNLRAALEGAL